MTEAKANAADAEIALFDGIPVAMISDASFKLNLPDTVMNETVRPVVGGRFAGRARTLDRARRPLNITQDEAVPAMKSGLKDVIEGSPPGSVIVAGTRGDAEVAIWGGNWTSRSKSLGIVGLVTDGAVRDLADMQAAEFPVHAQRVTPRGGGYRYYLTFAINQPIICGGVYVKAGDIIIADDDGVIVIDPKNAAALAAEARKVRAAEERAAKAT